MSLTNHHVIQNDSMTAGQSLIFTSPNLAVTLVSVIDEKTIVLAQSLTRQWVINAPKYGKGSTTLMHNQERLAELGKESKGMDLVENKS